MEYKVRTDAAGDFVACDSCGCEAPTGDFRVETTDKPPQALCEFCSTTLAGTYTRYAAGDEYTALRAEIWKAAACVFNMLKTSNAQVEATDRREVQHGK